MAAVRVRPCLRDGLQPRLPSRHRAVSPGDDGRARHGEVLPRGPVHGGNEMITEFIGLDIEATGADWQPPGQRPNYQRFAMCQIGLAYLYRNDVDTTLYGRKPEP